MHLHLDRLVEKIDSGTRYWKAVNLVRPYIQQTILPLLHGALGEILPAIRQRHEVHPDGPNQRATGVHYTTIGVLMQMLLCQQRTRAGRLRLYDSLHLNDPAEGYYLPRRITTKKQFAWIGDPGQHLPQDEVGGTVVGNAYMASFVAGDTASDDLVFWRTYGREGKGCSIVYSLDAKYLQKVLYDKDVEPTIELIRPVLDSLDPIVTASDTSICNLLAAQVWSSLRGILYLYKDRAYAYEDERRYVLLASEVDAADICYEYQDTHCGMPRIRHYLERPELSINDLLPSGSLITIGPCVPQADNVRRHLSTIARRAKLKGHPEIRLSRISYRQT